MKPAGVCDVTSHVITAVDVDGSRQCARPSPAGLYHPVGAGAQRKTWSSVSTTAVHGTIVRGVP